MTLNLTYVAGCNRGQFISTQTQILQSRFALLPGVETVVQPSPLPDASVLLLQTLDGIVEVELNATFAELDSTLAESISEPTYALADGMELFVLVGQEILARTVQFRVQDFVDITAATPEEVARVLSNQLLGVTASPLPGLQGAHPVYDYPSYSGYGVRMRHDVLGDESYLAVTGGSANDVLEFSSGSSAPTQATLVGARGPYNLLEVALSDTSLQVDGTPINFTVAATAAQLTSGTVTTTGFVGGETLDLEVRGTPVAIQFTANDQTLAQVVARLQSALRPTDPSGVVTELADVTTLIDTFQITDHDPGSASSLNVTGGTAVATLGLSVGVVTGSGDVASLSSSTVNELLAALTTALGASNGQALQDGQGTPVLRSTTLGSASTLYVDGTSNVLAGMGFSSFAFSQGQDSTEAEARGAAGMRLTLRSFSADPSLPENMIFIATGGVGKIETIRATAQGSTVELEITLYR